MDDEEFRWLPACCSDIVNLVLNRERTLGRFEVRECSFGPRALLPHFTCHRHLDANFQLEDKAGIRRGVSSNGRYHARRQLASLDIVSVQRQPIVEGIVMQTASATRMVREDVEHFVMLEVARGARNGAFDGALGRCHQGIAGSWV